MTNQEHSNKGQDSTGFVVKDRRRFDAQGTLRDQEPGNAKIGDYRVGSTSTASEILDLSYHPPQRNSTQPQNVTQQLNTGQVTSQTPQKTAPAPVEDEDEDINFSSFVVSLATQASIQLGLLAPPPGMDAPVDLEAAKQTIDILGLVERKTRGNLNDEEKNLLVNILHELRIGYVQIMKSQKKM
jgi:hypothetical protein